MTTVFQTPVAPGYNEGQNWEILVLYGGALEEIPYTEGYILWEPGCTCKFSTGLFLIARFPLYSNVRVLRAR